jgi:hypothetical protein
MKALPKFEKWASLFSGKIFVKIAAYVDESGRHDKTGRQEGAAQIIVAGWVDWADNHPSPKQAWNILKPC